MTELISKIQYKTCEKGEFFDERTRSLDETIQLIKTFPWDEQRGSDIQLSGPGIVIQNPRGEYLKVALYFNGKFSCYFLDKGNHLYEYHTPELLKECKMVEDFFDDKLELTAFYKHLFNIGNRSHFNTREFIYRINKWLSVQLLVAVYWIGTVSIFAVNNQMFTMLLITLVMIPVTIYQVWHYFFYDKHYLQISKGHDDFYYGDTPDTIKAYNKQDVKEVVIYETRSRNSRFAPRRIEIYFKNGERLKLTDSIISSYTLMYKFKDDLVRIEYIYQWPFNS